MQKPKTIPNVTLIIISFISVSSSLIIRQFVFIIIHKKAKIDNDYSMQKLQNPPDWVVICTQNEPGLSRDKSIFDQELFFTVLTMNKTKNYR